MSQDDPRIELAPIGVVRSPWKDKHETPRQPAFARGTAGRIEIVAGSEYEHALEDLETWTHIWVVFWFHRSSGFRPKVLPPRSETKRGVFATRSPNRPNPIGLSVLRLERVEGRVLHVLDVDMIDGTPVLDVKPYVAYTDSIPAAGSGWLDRAGEPADPGPTYEVTYAPEAERQLAWLEGRAAVDVRAIAEKVLRAGPAPHPYRRIRAHADHFSLGVKDFRVRFTVADNIVTVQHITTGYRPRVLADPSAQATEHTPLSVHREFVEQFGRR